MTDDLIAFVRDLTKTDPKNLTQKALKFSEEAGELAKKVLPMENAYGTTHRFIQKTDILEEIADCNLVGLSIVFDLGFTVEDLEAMMAKKALKWDGLQKRERKAKWPCPFEIHITVKGADAGMFKTACEEIGIKPVLIDAQTQDGESVFMDLQTSQVHVGTNRSAYEAMLLSAAALRMR